MRSGILRTLELFMLHADGLRMLKGAKRVLGCTYDRPCQQEADGHNARDLGRDVGADPHVLVASSRTGLRGHSRRIGPEGHQSDEFSSAGAALLTRQGKSHGPVER